MILPALLLLTLTGCAASPVESAEPAAVDEPQGSASQADGTFDGQAALDSVTSCAQVEAIFGAYTEGLDQIDDEVTEWGAYCQWDTPEGATDFSQIRSVTVSLQRREDSEPPALDALEQMDGFAREKAPAVEARGGVAYSLTMGTAVTGVIVTSVLLPGVEATVTGGTWGDYPALDGPAAVAGIVQLLGL